MTPLKCWWHWSASKLEHQSILIASLGQSEESCISWAAWVPIAQLGLFQVGSRPAWCQWSGDMRWENTRAVWAPMCPAWWAAVPALGGCAGEAGGGSHLGKCTYQSAAELKPCFVSCWLKKSVFLSLSDSQIRNFIAFFWEKFSKKLGLSEKNTVGGNPPLSQTGKGKWLLLTCLNILFPCF